MSSRCIPVRAAMFIIAILPPTKPPKQRTRSTSDECANVLDFKQFIYLSRCERALLSLAGCVCASVCVCESICSACLCAHELGEGFLPYIECVCWFVCVCLSHYMGFALQHHPNDVGTKSVNCIFKYVYNTHTHM